MTTLQFTLFFVALVIALALVHIQLGKAQARLDELSRLGRIEDRVAAMVQAVERLRLEPLESGLRELRGDLAVVVEGLARVEHAAARPVVIPPQQLVAAPAPTGAGPSAAERLRMVVENHLGDRGYSRVRILTDLSAVTADEDLDVIVECDRGSMPAKGKVITRAGEVRDSQIQMLAQMFP